MKKKKLNTRKINVGNVMKSIFLVHASRCATMLYHSPMASISALHRKSVIHVNVQQWKHSVEGLLPATNVTSPTRITGKHTNRNEHKSPLGFFFSSSILCLNQTGGCYSEEAWDFERQQQTGRELRSLTTLMPIRAHLFWPALCLSMSFSPYPAPAPPNGMPFSKKLDVTKG